MHEFGLCEDILGAVERRADGRRVSTVRVRVGAMHRVDEPSLAQAFSLVAAGTVAEGAAIEVVPVPTTIACRDCGARTATHDAFGVCPACGGTDLDTTGGDELVLESITVAPLAPSGGSSNVSRDRG